MPLYPLQIACGLTTARTGASEVRGRRLAAWAMSQPIFKKYEIFMDNFLVECEYNLKQRQISMYVYTHI
jgi:hypothetical protein